MEEPFSFENLKNFYIERLGSISSKKELETALQKKQVDLELKIDEIVPPERRDEILRENPDSIKIAEKERRVKYSYDDWNRSFTASVKVPAADVLKLKEAPILPSGRNLTLEIVSKEGQTYVEFSGTDLEELKQKSRKFLIKKQWDEWRNSEAGPKEQNLEDFDLLGDLPDLPEPVKFGSDPETEEPLFAYPAVAVESSYYGRNRFFVRYFSSREEAEQAQAKVLEIMERAKEEKRKKEERERLLGPARELLQKIKADFDNIGYDYEDYGLSYNEKSEIKNKLWEAERELESDTKKYFNILQEIDRRFGQALDYYEQRKLAKEKVEAAISKYYSVCPLCGQPIEGGECTNAEHKPEEIDFELDEEGYEIGPVVLSQIITDKGEIVAQLRVSDGGRGYYRGDVYIVSGSDLRENAWQGEPFESLRFEDFKKILSPDQAKERKARLEERERAEALKSYQEDLEYANQQVKEGYWKQGKFIKGTHPKTGEEQWELTLKSKGLTVKYVIDRRSQQPTSEDMTYFYSEGRVLVDTSRFRLILVWLENPLPENRPEELEERRPSTEVSKSDKNSSIESFADSLEKLKKKWGAK